MMKTGLQDTMIWRTRTLGGKPVILYFSTPKLMGILNITPDSFYDGGKYLDAEAALAQAGRMLADGAAILDIGAVSTRPGASAVTADEEWKRLYPVLKTLREKYPDAIVSVDTSSAEIVRLAAANGAGIINDISGGNFDSSMFNAVAETGLPYVLMHIQGNPENMQVAPHYNNVVEEVKQYFLDRIEGLEQAGVQQIMLDPGFGFGKTLEHNYRLLASLGEFCALGFPVLAGISRKRMITQLIGTGKEHALNATTAAHVIALMNGAAVLRVHDVKEATEAIKIVGAVQNS